MNTEQYRLCINLPNWSGYSPDFCGPTTSKMEAVTAAQIARNSGLVPQVQGKTPRMKRWEELPEKYWHKEPTR